MSYFGKTSFLLRPANKNDECPVTVTHFYARDGERSTFTKGTAVKVPANCFNDKTGKVHTLVNAPELNSAIQQVVNDIDKAARNVVGRGGNLLQKEQLAAEYAAVVGLRERITRIQPKLRRIDATRLEDLRQELSELEAQIADKKAEIEAEELSQNIVEKWLLTGFCKRYSAEIKSLTKNSKSALVTLENLLVRFRPLWRINDVNAKTLKEFQDWMIDANYESGTIKENITKVKQVVRHFHVEMNVNIESMTTFKRSFTVKARQNAIYLNQIQLDDLYNLHLERDLFRDVRDQFVLMCFTGLRFSDSNITRADVQGSDIRLFNQKSGVFVEIAIGRKLREILERHPEGFKKVHQSHFNRYIKIICGMVPSISTVKEPKRSYKGTVADTKHIAKHLLVSCHTGRRTMINLALAAGINPKAIAGTAGHSGVKLLMGTYGSSEAGRERIAEISE